MKHDPISKTDTVGDFIAHYLAEIGVSVMFGVISIHNMPILDAVARQGRIRFVPARGEAGGEAAEDDGEARGARQQTEDSVRRRTGERRLDRAEQRRVERVDRACHGALTRAALAAPCDSSVEG